MTTYDEFVAGKLLDVGASGFDTLVDADRFKLSGFQRDIVRWALRRGRCAVFADTGLGKTRMQLAWASHIPGDVLILAPLAVASQTVREGQAIGVNVTLCREQEDVRPGINIINYDRMHKIDCSKFSGVVLDESSIIKSYSGKTVAALLSAFHATPYKLAATATPSPNDYTELGQHAEFLGVCSREEMLAEFFVHDNGETQTWRLKGHARKEFWRWLSQWACMIRKPSDIGYSDDGYVLKPMTVEFHISQLENKDAWAAGHLFAAEASALMDRRAARCASLDKRVRACCDLVNREADERWVVWCEYNDESDALLDGIPGAVEIRGNQSIEVKEREIELFSSGGTRVLISKPSITGWGLNWQHVARMAFVGVSDSYESFYQAVRRSWRFGQQRDVQVHMFACETEGAVMRNMDKKRTAHDDMALEMTEFVRTSVQSLGETKKQTNAYNPAAAIRLPSWMAT